MSTVEEILEAVKELPPEKKDELKHRLMSLWLLWENLTVNWATTDPVHRDQFLTASRIRNRQHRERRPPIQIKGKPHIGDCN
jgi:hypothetical protein